MKKTTLLAIIFLPSLLMLSFVLMQGSPTGMAVSDFDGVPGAVPAFGPGEDERDCVMACGTSQGCTPGDMDCMITKRDICLAQCNVQKPEQTEEETCVEECAKQYCEEFDFICQESYQAECDKQCGMVQEPEPRSEEEACIRECVRKVDPALMCSGGPEGETGNEVCQRCAAECVNLYAGPCLGEEKLEEKKQACVTCEQCYGEPVMGDSGEGYDCIVDVVCKDASAEFGDEPGSGPGVFDEGGAVDRARDSVSNVFSRVGNFFRGLFGIGEEAAESPAAEEAPQEEARSEEPAESAPSE